MAACLSLLAVLGCMSISIGNSDCAAGEFKQEGTFRVQTGQEVLVYYPVPFGSPPNLEVEDTFGLCEIVEQKENYFRVRYGKNVTGWHTYSWTARGIHAPSAVTVVAPTTVVTGNDAPAPATMLPPVPVTTQRGN
jgi:hypothetical protein